MINQIILNGKNLPKPVSTLWRSTNGGEFGELWMNQTFLRIPLEWKYILSKVVCCEYFLHIEAGGDPPYVKHLHNVGK